MIPALRYEAVRLVTIRSTYWLIGTTMVLYAILTAVVAANVHDTRSSFVDPEQIAAGVVTLGASTGYAPLLMAYVIAIIGVFSMGHEYRHGMIRATLTTVPNRVAVVAAKILTIAVIAAVTSFLACVIGIVNARLFSDADLPVMSGTVYEVVLGVVIYTVLFSVCGLVLAGLLRNQTAALAVLLFFPTVIESILRILLLLPRLVSQSDDTGGLATLIRYLPFDAGGKMYTSVALPDLTDIVGTRPLGPVAGGFVMTGFVGVLFALMLYRFVRKDA